MASGLPDYHSIIRSTFGGALPTASVRVVNANDITLLTSIVGKGILYGGLIYLAYTSTQKDSEIYVEIDGIHWLTDSFKSLNDYGAVKPMCYPFTSLKYDDVAFVYSVGLSYGITFEASLKVYYLEEHGTTPTVIAKVLYALI